MIEIVESNWRSRLAVAAQESSGVLRVISPFMKRTAVEWLLDQRSYPSVQVITRFNLHDLYQAVSDLSALRSLLDVGAEIKGVRNLHAKVFVFGNDKAIVGSANLTNSGLARNHEVGILSDEEEVVRACHEYFGRLWSRTDILLDHERLQRWESLISTTVQQSGPAPRPSGLPDEGADCGLPPEVRTGFDWLGAEQTIVKFFGRGDNRASRMLPVIQEVERSGCHWACAYPEGKRPRNVHDGDVVYMGRFVEDPNDIMIFGRAIASAHVEGRDDATAEDIERRTWKAHYPHYIRVRGPEFLSGTLDEAVSLYELTNVLGEDSFATHRSPPRVSIRQQPAVRLSDAGKAWLDNQFNRKSVELGCIPGSDLARLDWPRDSVQPDRFYRVNTCRGSDPERRHEDYMLGQRCALTSQSHEDEQRGNRAHLDLIEGIPEGAGVFLVADRDGIIATGIATGEREERRIEQIGSLNASVVLLSNWRPVVPSIPPREIRHISDPRISFRGSVKELRSDVGRLLWEHSQQQTRSIS